MKMLTAWVSLMMILGSSCLSGGCKGPGPKDWQEQKEQINQVLEIAKATGAAATVTVNWQGRPSVGVSTDFYMETGVTASATIQANAK